MRLLHLGDLHIGKSVNDYSMIDDQRFILDRILTVANEKKIDAILIAGDVYDKSVPSEEAVKLLDYFLCSLADRKVKTFIISGNHDSDERLHFGSSLFASNEIYISSRYEGELRKYSLEDRDGVINIYLLPFVKASQVKHFFPEEEITSYDHAVRVILKHTEINEKECNILAAHQFVAGKGEEPLMGGSENMAVQHVGTVEKIGVDCFDAFHYVALGHIHSPQQVGRETVRYSGSPLKYSFSEIGSQKSVPVITASGAGNIDVELVELTPMRDMRHIKGRLEQLMDKDHIVSPEDYIYATLTDEDPVPEAMAVIRQAYPNTMKIDYENSHTRQMAQQKEIETVAEKSFDELIAGFYQMMYGCEISDREMACMMEAAGEAGVVDEAD